jgi:hypothetical protein
MSSFSAINANIKTLGWEIIEPWEQMSISDMNCYDTNTYISVEQKSNIEYNDEYEFIHNIIHKIFIIIPHRICKSDHNNPDNWYCINFIIQLRVPLNCSDHTLEKQINITVNTFIEVKTELINKVKVKNYNKSISRIIEMITQKKIKF